MFQDFILKNKYMYKRNSKVCFHDVVVIALVVFENLVD